MLALTAAHAGLPRLHAKPHDSRAGRLAHALVGALGRAGGRAGAHRGDGWEGSVSSSTSSSDPGVPLKRPVPEGPWGLTFVLAAVLFAVAMSSLEPLLAKPRPGAHRRRQPRALVLRARLRVPGPSSLAQEARARGRVAPALRRRSRRDLRTGCPTTTSSSSRSWARRRWQTLRDPGRRREPAGRVQSSLDVAEHALERSLLAGPAGVGRDTSMRGVKTSRPTSRNPRLGRATGRASSWPTPSWGSP